MQTIQIVVFLAAMAPWNGSALAHSGHSLDRQVFCMNSVGSDITRLSSDILGGASNPAWGPDGRSILYATREDDEISLKLLSLLDLSELRLDLTTRMVRQESFSWSPDGTQLALAGATDRPDQSHRWDLYILKVGELVDTVNLTKDLPYAYIITPSWSPDGATIAYAAMMDGLMSIEVMELERLKTRVLAEGFSYARNPSWSPDGKRIAFACRLKDNMEIFTVNADGSGLRNLSQHVAGDWHPAWSPNGSEIAFASNRGGDWDIYCMATDGSAVTRMTFGSADDHQPTWSPDGHHIAFISDRNESVHERFRRWFWEIPAD